MYNAYTATPKILEKKRKNSLDYKIKNIFISLCGGGLKMYHTPLFVFFLDTSYTHIMYIFIPAAGRRLIASGGKGLNIGF